MAPLRRLSGLWEWTVNLLTVGIILAALLGIGAAYFNSVDAKDSSQSGAQSAASANTNAQAAKRLSYVAVQQNKRIEQEAKVIAYLGGVIVYQNSELQQEISAHSGELNSLQHLLDQISGQIPLVTSSLVAGQKQLLLCVQMRTPAACGG